MVKIAIQGHPTKGKEVIKILENLGGNNDALFEGVKDFYYFIDSDKHITNDYQHVLNIAGFKTYTLEEFKKEFPFKIGDIVINNKGDEGFIVDLVTINNKLLYSIKYNYNQFDAVSPNLLKLKNKEMNTRNITLTLDKAKEWYKKGGELREVALQAYSEKELIKVELPKTWEEFCNNHMIKDNEAYFDSCSIIHLLNETCRNSEYDKNTCPSKKSAEAHLALIQLEQLRDCYRQGDIPDFNNNNDKKYCIIKTGDCIHVAISYSTSYFLSFTKQEIAEEFLINFKPLIKIAEDYI